VHHKEEFLGVDVGATRVGIARGSSLAKIAEPLKTIAAAQAIYELLTDVSQNSAVGIVVGLQRSLDGNETEQTKIARSWVENAKKQIDLPFYWQDEALTSQTAETHKSASPHGNDAEAAAIILQDFLNTNGAERVKA
jgi:putative Holliday junction resolvase